MREHNPMRILYESCVTRCWDVWSDASNSIKFNVSSLTQIPEICMHIATITAIVLSKKSNLIKDSGSEMN